jgi:Domain of unknown function (DUF4157)
MSNALVNRIRQRLEARRDFMRSVFSKHHALTWRMTDAPSLRALGIQPKKAEPNRPRVLQAPTNAKVQARNSRAVRNPDLALQASQIERSFEVAQPTPETMVTDSGFVAPEPLNFETQAGMSLETQEPTVEVISQLEDSDQTEPTVQAPTKLDPARAREIFERREALATPESRAGVVPTVRSGETTPPEVSPRANIEKPVSDDVVTPRVELGEAASSQVFKPEETRVLEQNEEITESSKPDGEQIIQNINNSMVEPQMTPPEKIENPQSNQNKPSTAARASEILRQRAAQAAQPSNSSTNQRPDQTQKIVPESQNQLEPTALRQTENQARAVFESNENAKLENPKESNLEPEVVTRDAIETAQINTEILTPAEVQTSRFEPVTEQSTNQSTPNIETREAEIQKPDVAAREMTSESVRTEIQEVSQPAQELVAREIVQEPVLMETAPEFEVQEVRREPVTRDAPQETTTQETRTEPQTEAGSPEVSNSGQADWQRSTPGDPQSGVVEIIRAKPPRNLRSERPETPTEPREDTVKPATQTPETRVSQEVANPPKQNLAERMKSLNQRYGGTEQSRFDPSTNTFSQRVEIDETKQTPAPNFQSISDVAQRLARRYSQTPSTTSSEEENSSLDLKVGQQLNQSQTRAASGFVQQGTQPVQLRESTSTFLAPLIGFDPSLARVFVGPRASEFTSSLNADGATVETDVYLNNGFDEQSAEGLGLLAHELTHVGQNLQPDFVPPMLQNFTDQHDFTGASLETQARAVEARVTNTASLFIPGIALEAATGSRQTSTASTAPSGGNATLNNDAWNGLPAPWEAMPNLNTNPSDFVTVIAPSPVGSNSTSTGFVPVADTPNAGVQLAESDRPTENPDNVSHGAAGGQPHPPAQDMDLLAQQVYEILKRRLSSERRREG